MDVTERLQILRRRGFTEAEMAAILGVDLVDVTQEALDSSIVPAVPGELTIFRAGLRTFDEPSDPVWEFARRAHLENDAHTFSVTYGPIIVTPGGRVAALRFPEESREGVTELGYTEFSVASYDGTERKGLRAFSLDFDEALNVNTVKGSYWGSFAGVGTDLTVGTSGTDDGFVISTAGGTFFVTLWLTIPDLD